MKAKKRTFDFDTFRDWIRELSSKNEKLGDHHEVGKGFKEDGPFDVIIVDHLTSPKAYAYHNLIFVKLKEDEDPTQMYFYSDITTPTDTTENEFCNGNSVVVYIKKQEFKNAIRSGNEKNALLTVTCNIKRRKRTFHIKIRPRTTY